MARRSSRIRKTVLKASPPEDDFQIVLQIVQGAGFHNILQVAGDGACLYRSLSDQVNRDGGNGRGHRTVRANICNHMAKFKDKYSPYVVLRSRDHGAKVLEGEEAFPSFKAYLSNMRNPKTFGGEVEIKAFVDASRRPVTVFTANGKVFYEYDGSDPDPAGTLYLSYHNGVHYNSVRPFGDDAITAGKMWGDDQTEELFVHWESIALDPLDIRKAYLKRAFNDMSESIKTLGIGSFERNYKEKGEKYANDKGEWKLLITFRLSGGKIRTAEERRAHLRQLRNDRMVGGDTNVEQSDKTVESADSCTTGDCIETNDGDRNGFKIGGDTIVEQSDKTVESTEACTTGDRIETNGFKTPNDSSHHRIGKKSTVTFNLCDDKNPVNNVWDGESSDDEDCDPDLFAQFQSLKLESDFSKAIVLKQQDAEEYSKRAETHAIDARTHAIEARTYATDTVKELESMQGTHKKLLSIKAKTPSRKMRRMIDGEIQNLGQTCQTVIKAKRPVDESLRPHTEPRTKRPFESDSDSDSDLHPINQAQEAAKGKPSLKTPGRLF